MGRMIFDQSDQVEKMVQLLLTNQNQSDGFHFLLLCIGAWHAFSCKGRSEGLMTLWTVERLCVIHAVHLRCLTRFLRSTSKSSICEPHRPVPGLSHAPSSPAAQAHGSSCNPPPCLLNHLLLSSLIPPNAALPDCVHAWILSLEKQLCADIS